MCNLNLILNLNLELFSRGLYQCLPNPGRTFSEARRKGHGYDLRD